MVIHLKVILMMNLNPTGCGFYYFKEDSKTYFVTSMEFMIYRRCVNGKNVSIKIDMISR